MTALWCSHTLTFVLQIFIPSDSHTSACLVESFWLWIMFSGAFPVLSKRFENLISISHISYNVMSPQYYLYYYLYYYMIVIYYKLYSQILQLHSGFSYASLDVFFSLSECFLNSVRLYFAMCVCSDCGVALLCCAYLLDCLFSFSLLCTNGVFWPSFG